MFADEGAFLHTQVRVERFLALHWDRAMQPQYPEHVDWLAVLLQPEPNGPQLPEGLSPGQRIRLIGRDSLGWLVERPNVDEGQTWDVDPSLLELLPREQEPLSRWEIAIGKESPIRGSRDNPANEP